MKNEIVSLDSKETVVSVRSFHGVLTVYRNVRDVVIGDGCVSFTTKNNVRLVISPAMRWEVFRNLD
jgi:hypothetical protein